MAPSDPGRKNPEILHIFFSGPGVERALREYRFSPRELSVIREAIANARTPNPDIDLLRRADAIITAAKAARAPLPPHTGDSGGLSSLSGHFTPPENREKIPFWQGRGRSLIGYLNWRWNWKHIYLPILTLLLIGGVLLLVRMFPTVGEGIRSSGLMQMNVGTFEEAQKICRDLGKELAASPGEILPRLDRISEAQNTYGYWLRDGRVFVPKTGTTHPGDALRHWFVCVDD